MKDYFYITLWAVLILPISAATLSFFNQDQGLALLLHEDRILETFSVFLWLAVIAFSVRFIVRHKLRFYAFSGYTLLALFAFFVAMEEISWGQRLFGVETSSFFQQHNLQGENNFHNLEVANIKVNRFLTQRVTPIFFLLYFFVLPGLYKRKYRVASFLVDVVRVPICPKKYLLPLFIYMLITYTSVDHGRHGELGEFFFPYLILVLLVRHDWTYKAGERG